MSNPIPILILVPSLACGGLERNVSLLCNHINTKKFRVTLAVADNSDPFYTITNTDVQVINLGCKRVRDALPSILRLVKQIQPQLVLSTANHLNLLLGIFRFRIPGQIPVLARESSIVSLNSQRARMAGLYDLVQKKFYKKLDMVICQSAYMRHDLVTHYGIAAAKTCIIPNPLQVPVEQWQEKKSGTDKIFLSVGRLSEEKGIDRILMALAGLKIPYRYYVVGGGPEMEKLRKLAAKLGIDHRVYFTGSHKDPFTQCPEPDLFLMASQYEGFPNAMLEALSLGIPAVAYKAPGGIMDLAEQGINGWLVEEQQPEAMTAGIEKALTISFNRQQIRSVTREHYRADRIIQTWESLFSATIASYKAPSTMLG